MKSIWHGTQAVLSAAGALLGWFLGGINGFLYVLIAFVVADYLTGVMCAVLDHSLCSTVGARGIFKKVLIFILVGIGHMVDVYLIGAGDTLRTAVIFFYLSNEGISLLENASRLGLPVPAQLKNVLATLHQKTHDDDGKGGGDAPPGGEGPQDGK